MDHEEKGPRGGTSTRRRGMVRKTLWLSDEENEALRRAAFDQRSTESAIVRGLIRERFELSED